MLEAGGTHPISYLNVFLLLPSPTLRQGNVFTRVCGSVHRVGEAGDLCPGGLCPGGSLSGGGGLSPGGISVQGVSVQGVSVLEVGVCVQGVLVQGGLCPWGLCPWGLCPWGLCPGASLSGGSLSTGSLSRGLCQGDPHCCHTVTCGRYTSYWHAFLLRKYIYHSCMHTVEEELGILTYNGPMFSLPHFHFQFKSVNISIILTSKLKMCTYI